MDIEDLIINSDKDTECNECGSLICKGRSIAICPKCGHQLCKTCVESFIEGHVWSCECNELYITKNFFKI